MHSHHTRTIIEKGEDAEAAPPPVIPANIDPERITGIGSTAEESAAADDDASSVSTAAATRIALARDQSVRLAKDVTQSVGQAVEKLHLGDRIGDTKTAAAELGQTATATTQRAVQGTRLSLVSAAEGIGTSVRNLDSRLKVSQTVEKVAGKARDGTGTANKAAAPTVSPLDILRSEGTLAQTLTMSDQHVTFLLTHTVLDDSGDEDAKEKEEGLSIEYREEDSGASDDAKEQADEEVKGSKEPKTIKSLLKLTVVPFHKQLLEHTLPSAEVADSAAAPAYTSLTALCESDESKSRDILGFLSGYNFDLTSFSGAEYSYWNANPGGRLRPLIGAAGQMLSKPIGNLIGRLGSKKKITGKEDGDDAVSVAASESSQQKPVKSVVRNKAGSFTVELISPASERQIQRASPSPSMSLVEETPEIYKNVTKPHIESIVAGGSLDWIKNVVNGTKEAERLIYDHESYIINCDTKWRSHPDPNTVPREEWLHHPSTADLYCLGIFKADDVACIRDLRAEHVPTLKSMITDGIDAIERTYGVSRDQVRCFVHYQPQFMHFHVHYTRLNNEIGCQVERGHLLRDIIQDLQMDPLFYEKRIMTYKLKVTDALYKKIDKYQQGASEENY